MIATIDSVPLRPTRTVKDDSRVADALRMLESDGEALCVLDDEGRVIGTVSARDLRNLVFSRTSVVSQCVNTHAYPVSSDLPVADVADALGDDPDILVIPVVSTASGDLVGLVRREDVLRAAGRAVAPQPPRALRLPEPAPATSGGYGSHNNTTVIRNPRLSRTLSRVREERTGASA